MAGGEAGGGSGLGGEKKVNSISNIQHGMSNVQVVGRREGLFTIHSPRPMITLHDFGVMWFFLGGIGGGALGN